jgi:hypothetical protein
MWSYICPTFLKDNTFLFYSNKLSNLRTSYQIRPCPTSFFTTAVINKTNYQKLIRWCIKIQQAIFGSSTNINNIINYKLFLVSVPSQVSLDLLYIVYTLLLELYQGKGGLAFYMTCRCMINWEKMKGTIHGICFTGTW